MPLIVGLFALKSTDVRQKSLSLTSVMSAWLRGQWKWYAGILQIQFKIRSKSMYLKQELVFSTYCITVTKHAYV